MPLCRVEHPPPHGEAPGSRRPCWLGKTRSIRPGSGHGQPMAQCERTTVSSDRITPNHLFFGCVFLWYRDVSFVVSRWPKSPFCYRDLFFGIEISFLISRSLFSVVHHQIIFPWGQPVRAKKIAIPKRPKISMPKKDVAIPTKRVNNSQNHFRSVSWMSVILHSQILQTHCKPGITWTIFREVKVGNLLTD